MKKPLFEFEDMPRFPDTIRRSMVDYLSFILLKADVYKPIVPLIAECLEHAGEKRVLDMCSGGGGPMLQVQANLEAVMQKPVPFTLTDKFPNISAFAHIEKISGGKISYIKEPVDATNVPAGIKGVRTCFSALHHFEPGQVKQILQNAIASKQPVAIFDGADKNLLIILAMILGHPVVFFFCTPFFRPFRFSRIFFTYIIPIIPVCTVWDGVVSILRLYRPKELEAIIAEVDDGSYTWQTGTKRHPLGFSVAYLTGYPKL
jgi:hypothetical protein